MPYDKNSRISDLGNDLTPEQAAKLFASDIDPAIIQAFTALKSLGFTEEDFMRLTAELDHLLSTVMPIPEDVTVADAEEYVRVTDLVSLGAITYELYKRRDLIPKDWKH